MPASRVLPGFEPDSKLRMLMKLSDRAEMSRGFNIFIFSIAFVADDKRNIRWIPFYGIV